MCIQFNKLYHEFATAFNYKLTLLVYMSTIPFRSGCKQVISDKRNEQLAGITYSLPNIFLVHASSFPQNLTILFTTDSVTV